jgi:hypothetical protein
MSSKARGLADLGNVYDDGALSNRNLIINGAMQVWQRGTSVSATSSGYSTADRWRHNASGGNLSLSRQSLTLGQADIPQQFKYYYRLDVTTGNDNAGIATRIEDVDSVQGVHTLSFYAKGTNPNSGNVQITLAQYFGSGGSAYADQTETITLTSSWKRFVITFTPQNILGKTIGSGSYFQVYFSQPSNDTSTAAWTLDFTGVQLEVGDTATPFEHRSYGDELARCQRYYYRLPPNTETVFASLFNARHVCRVPFPTTMRANPSASTPTWNTGRYGGGSFLSGATLTINATFPATDGYGWDVSSSTSPLQNQSGAMELTTATTFDAEL